MNMQNCKHLLMPCPQEGPIRTKHKFASYVHTFSWCPPPPRPHPQLQKGPLRCAYKKSQTTIRWWDLFARAQSACPEQAVGSVQVSGHSTPRESRRT
jgi:hypothetical protein